MDPSAARHHGREGPIKKRVNRCCWRARLWGRAEKEVSYITGSEPDHVEL